MSTDKTQNNTFTEKHSLAMKYYQQGKLVEANVIFSDLIQSNPEISELLLVSGNICFELKDYKRAFDLLEKFQAFQPNNKIVLLLLAKCLVNLGDKNGAEKHFFNILHRYPNYTDVYVELGLLYIEQDKLKQALLVLRNAIAKDFNNYVAHGYMSEAYKKLNLKFSLQVHICLFYHFHPDPNKKYVNDKILDKYFIDRELAMDTALRANRVILTEAATGLQMCYYQGEKFDNPPPNLIHLPSDDIYQFISNTRLREPTFIQFDPDNEIECKEAISVAEKYEKSIEKLNIVFNENYWACKKTKLEFKDSEPLRIFMFASITTTVMQHCSRAVSDALVRNGCDVKFLIEENDTEQLTMSYIYNELAQFAPHCMFNINNVNNVFLSDDTYNIVWWQDLMENLLLGEQIPWRSRDIVLSAYLQFDPYIYNTGAKKVYRQDFGVDLENFSSITPLNERKKIVFVGSSYINSGSLYGDTGKKIVALLKEKMNMGEIISDRYLQQLSEKYAVPFIEIFENLLPYVVRDTAIEWLCSIAGDIDYDVEVYGRFWESNPIVAPYFKGILPHGPKLAKLYNGAKYGISAIHRHINSQRLVELSACGCIPVVFDQRSYREAEPPYWVDECLYFNTKDELKECIGLTPKNDAKTISQAYSYDQFAKNIITLLKTGEYPAQPVARTQLPDYL
ncbi:MAG: hypothetical protein HQL69_08075 [Magnetococcales bacterium]|nr:hypothetical protein [Magnetococcales bacterium]